MSDKFSDAPEDHTRTSTRAVDMLPAGTILAQRYRIEEVIGVGGMGMVYRAHDLQLETDIAIKVLRTEHAPDDDAMARFRREVLLTRKISHPNVLRLHDLAQDGNLVFLTMDHVAGRTLREVLAEGPMDIQATVRLGIQIAEALAAAHDQGVIHRDLKPGNILIDDDGNALLLDFGVARAMDQEQLTVAGEVVGTPAYLSPEQVRGETVSSASDIFTLGLILCEALTGRLPQSEGTIDELLGQRASGRSIDPSRLQVDLPGWLTRVLRNCLAARPEDRYQQARALAKDLETGRSRTLSNRRIRAWGIGLAAAATVVVLFVLFFPAEVARTPIGETTVHVAILPIENATGRDTMDWAGRSVAQSLAETLAEAPSLQVTESLRVFRLMQDLALPAGIPDASARRQLFELLDVERLVTGQLLPTDDGYRLELTVFDDGMGDGNRIIGESASADLMGALPGIAEAVMEQLTGHRLSLPPPPGTTDTEALEYFDRGTALLARRETVSAIEALEASVAADAEFAAAWTSLSRALASAGHYARAIDSAERAVSLLADHGGRLALEARATLAELEGDLELAATTLEQISEQYPGDIRARIRLADLLIDQGRLESARTWLEQVVESEPQNGEAWFLLGKAAIMSGDFARASEDYLVRALVIENRTNSIQGKGDVINALGIAHLQLGNLKVASDYFTEAVDLREQAGDRRGAAATRANLAHLSMLLGQFDQATEQLQLAIADRQALGDQAGMADLYNQQGVVAEETGQYRAALESYREALRLHETLGHGRALADTYNNVAFAYFMLGQYDNARQFNRSALERLDPDERPAGRIMALETRGYLASSSGNWDDALQAFVEALELARALDQPASEAVARGGIGLVAAGQGRYAAALEAIEEALEIVQQIGDRRGERIYRLKLAELKFDAGRLDRSAELIETIDDELGEGSAAMTRAEINHLRGRLAAAHDEPDLAREYFQSARDIADSSGMEVHSLSAALELNRLQPEADWDVLIAQVERSGDALLLLEALTAAAFDLLNAGEREQAARMAQRGLRPPNRVTPWAGNWRLHWLLALTADPAPGHAAMQRAGEEIERLMQELPEDWIEDFSSTLPEELRDVEVKTR